MAIDYTIEGMTLAVHQMDKMIQFYSNVFNIQFEAKEMFDNTLYSGTWGDLKVLFCPAELAGNEARQNRHQFDIITTNLEGCIDNVKMNGGSLMGEISEDDNMKSIGIYDPDHNSIVLKQPKG
ncbi:MAG: VOC family protein [Bacteroidota bacterium]